MNKVLRQNVAVFKIDSMLQMDHCGNNSHVLRERTGSVADDRKGNVGPRHSVVTHANVAKVSGIV